MFFKQLALRQKELNSLLCVGLDPDIKRIPASVLIKSEPIFAFNKAIVDVTSDLTACYKLQIAHYSSEAAEDQLEKTIEYIKNKNIPVILDAKRGDIGSTAERYARELFERFGADAATVNPFLGGDSLKPYLDYKDKGVFVLCRTSNAGGQDVQGLVLESGQRVFEKIAEKISEDWNYNDNVGLVVGATYPKDLARVREIVGALTILIPGVGAQGADIGSAIGAAGGEGVLISSSRAIIYAGEDNFSEDAIRKSAIETRDQIRFHIEKAN
ncbi:MAG: orotidine-5'-phosphate decarboxylase [Gammaproteobacteria bacterium]|nr:orotidine-5'-phosphate decarboxylase [Gammaproteobacteria bacterium]